MSEKTSNIQQIYPCPNCEKSMVYDEKSPHRPFCSRSCKNSDLIAWSNEDFKIAGQETVDPEDEENLK